MRQCELAARKMMTFRTVTSATVNFRSRSLNRMSTNPNLHFTVRGDLFYGVELEVDKGGERSDYAESDFECCEQG